MCDKILMRSEFKIEYGICVFFAKATTYVIFVIIILILCASECKNALSFLRAFLSSMFKFVCALMIDIKGKKNQTFNLTSNSIGE